MLLVFLPSFPVILIIQMFVFSLKPICDLTEGLKSRISSTVQI